MVDTRSKIFLNWDHVEELVHLLAVKITIKYPEITSIAGLPRGGLIPAVILSHKLNLPLIEIENISKNTLIVDDICDSGETFIKLHDEFPHAVFSCLHFKPHTSKFSPDIWVKEWDLNDWIVYPWEKKDSKTIQDYLK